MGESGERSIVLPETYLICRQSERLEVVPLPEGKEIVVGRAPDAGVRVDSPRVARHHAKLRAEGGAVVVEDLGGRNGTRLDAVVLRSEARAAGSGATISAGPLQIVVAQSGLALDYERPIETETDRDRDPGARSADSLVVADPSMVRLFSMLRKLAPTGSAVLVLGETGVGKAIVAEQLHELGPRAGRPFVRVDCASAAEPLLESELFGHERGAFTGGGTLLLDEIDEMPLALQAKLLRVLETEPIEIDVRLVCATHRDLLGEVAAGRFRRDLYYRISTFTLDVPPLRQRQAESLLLADLFARRSAHQAGNPAPTLRPDAIATILTHPWPGNVRELRNAMEHAVVVAEGGEIAAAHFPRAMTAAAAAPKS